MSPEIFDHPLEDGSDDSHRDAIREGYIRNDAIVGRALRSYPDHTIVFATGLSQQPWTDTAKCMYRPHDFTAFLEFAGLKNVTVEPLMAEEFRVVGASCENFAQKLLSITRDGVPVMKASVIEGAVQAGCAINEGDSANLDTLVVGPNGTKRFGDVFYRLSAMRSGRHHPTGAFWIRDGSPHRVEPEPVTLESIAPTILAMLGVTPPGHHVSPLSTSNTKELLPV